jgi:AcrR family transcriptional regulator
MAERKRQMVRDELTEAALGLLARDGFEAITIDEIVAAAGVSRRTFFRYFDSKEDVIVQFLGDVGAELCAALAGRPAAEPPAVALRHAMSVLVQACADDPGKALRLVKLMLGTPTVLARYLQVQARWRDQLATELARRSGRPPQADLRPALAAAVALAAFDVALRQWADRDGAEDLAGLTDQVFAAVAPALRPAE